jgi:hypothetical protein
VSRGRLALEVACLGLWVLVLGTWFAAWFPSVGTWPPLLGLLALLAVASHRRWRGLLRLPRPETGLCLALGLLYRLPALVHPWGFVNKDGAYGAFVALHLLGGSRPAPVFTEGANYQGTLKGHLAALLSLVSGARDPSFLMAAASVLLSLLFVWASMWLARQLGGPLAALFTGLYLALGPKFLTTFSLNCVGQYVDVLALGGLALAILAHPLERDLSGPAARFHYLAVGLLLGAAFWQQPVALCYVVTVMLVVLGRRATWRDPWSLLLLLGGGLGVLPVLLWNLQHNWATGAILGQNVGAVGDTLRGLPQQVWRTVSISFPILAGLNRGHAWAERPLLEVVVALLPPALLVGHLVIHRRAAIRWLHGQGRVSVLIPPLLLVTCLGIFWSVPGEQIHFRPRYLLPLMAATAVHLGTVAAWSWTRARLATVLGVGVLLAVNLVGMVPRLRAAPRIGAYYRHLVSSLEAKGIRTGYSDFSISAPVTMFTSERIVLSPRLGPTPAYVSKRHQAVVEAQGPDAYVLPPSDDPERFAQVLRDLGVGFRYDDDPVPVFYALSRRVRLQEVWHFRELPPVERPHLRTTPRRRPVTLEDDP